MFGHGSTLLVVNQQRVRSKLFGQDYRFGLSITNRVSQRV